MRLSYGFEIESEKYEAHNDYHFGRVLLLLLFLMVDTDRLGEKKTHTKTNEEIIFLSSCLRFVRLNKRVWMDWLYALY